MSIHNTTATPNGIGQVGFPCLESLRLAARQGVGSQPLQAVDRLDPRIAAGGRIRPADQDETGLSAAEAVYVTRAHVLGSGND